MSHSEPIVVLRQGVDLQEWIVNLQSALVNQECLGHVFHDIVGVEPVITPKEPANAGRTAQESAAELIRYRIQLRNYTLGEVKARSALVSRISKEVRPTNMLDITAKELFDNVVKTCEERASIPYVLAVQKLLSTTFVTSPDSYCNEFMQNYNDVNNGAKSMVFKNKDLADEGGIDNFLVPPGLAGVIFILGTKHVDWLDTWRQTKVFDKENKHVPLETMMSTLRQTTFSRDLRSAGHGRLGH